MQYILIPALPHDFWNQYRRPATRRGYLQLSSKLQQGLVHRAVARLQDHEFRRIQASVLTRGLYVFAPLLAKLPAVEAKTFSCR